MLRLNTKIILCFYICSFLFGNSSQSIGLITKSIGNVKYKKNDEKNKFKLEVSQSLSNKDLIITGKDGFAKFVYFDDGSLIKVYKNSEILIEGIIDKSKILKKIIITKGIISLSINKQTNKGVTVITPNSSSIIKEGVFWIECNNDKQDNFINLSGIVDIKNSVSDKKMILDSRKMVSSFKEGVIIEGERFQKTIDYFNKLEKTMGEDSFRIQMYDDLGDVVDDNESDSKKVKIHLVNNEGITKKIIITLRKSEENEIE